MKKLIASILLGCIAYGLVSYKPESYIRNRVVKLEGIFGGTCSGEQIHTAKGHDYILTARHCQSLDFLGIGFILAENEAGKMYARKILRISPDSDLMLLQGFPKLRGLDLADKSERFEEIRMFGHGRGFPTFRTNGTIIGDTPTGIDGISESPLTAITAMSVPGCSGGPIVDSHGDIVGVVSATDGQLGYMIRLKDIKRFLKGL